MMRRRRVWLAGAGLVAAGALGCGDGGGAFGVDAPRLRVVAGAGVEDTITALLPQALVIEVRDGSGRPRPGVEVRFAPDTLASSGAYVALSPLSSSYFTSVLVDTTDARGRVAVLLRLGTLAGQATVEVSAPALGLRAVASYTVRPGAPAAVTAQPADTALYVGASFALRGEVRDRAGNARGEAVSYSVPAATAIAVTGGTVRGERVGRGYAVASFGASSDTAWVSVVPQGTIAAYSGRRMVGDTRGVVVVNLDGSGMRTVVLESGSPDEGGTEPPGHEMAPRWDPAGTRLTYQEHYFGFADRRVYTVTLAADTGVQLGTRLLPTSPFLSEFHPDFSRDGAWIYFSQWVAGDPRSRVRRVHPDGSGLEEIPRSPDDSFFEARPTPSPDGRWLAYSGENWGYEGPRVRVRSLATGQRTALDAVGSAPRWSPAGEWLAYVASFDNSGYSGALRIVRPDGTGDRQVGAVTVEPGVDWSPDGRFLIARDAERGCLALVEVGTGVVLPLAYSWFLSDPAWRPPTVGR